MPFDQSAGDGIEGEDISPRSVDTGELTGGVTGNLSVGKIFGERIVSQSPSGVTNADFTTGISADFDTYILKVTGAIPSSDSQDLLFRVSTDGGETFESGTTDYEYHTRQFKADGVAGSESSEGDSEIPLTVDNVGNATGEHFNGTIVISQPTNSSLFTTVRADCYYWSAARFPVRTITAGTYNGSATTTDSFRLTFRSGNIDTAEIDLLGVTD